jgi:putative oxidoreductase
MNILFILLLVLIFFIAGFNKIFSFDKTVNGLLHKPLFSSFPRFLSVLAIVIVIIIEIIAPIVIVYGSYDTRYSHYVKYGILSLILFTIMATLLYHNPFVDPKEKINFMKNLAIIGGLGILYM